MLVTEIQETNGSVVFVGGGWTTNTNAQASGGTEKYTTNPGDTCTLMFTGHSVFLVHRETPSWGWFSVTLDGVLLPNIYTSMCGETFSATTQGQCYRNLQQLVAGLVDGQHTIVLTCLAARAYQPRNGGVGFSVDSFLVCTGAKAQFGSTGNYSALGDSISNAYGCWQPDNAFTNKVAKELAQYRKTPVAVQIANYGDANDCAFCSNFSGTLRYGGQYKMFNYAYTNQANYITWMYGANDLRQQAGSSTAADLVRRCRNAINFYIAVFDTSQTKMVVCTPPYIGSYYTYDQTYAPSYAYQAASQDSYEFAADMIKRLAYQYPQVEFADVYGAMLYRDELIYPNAEGDYALHPNDTGHGVIAEVVLEAFSRFV